jgi:hypothetical protein
MNFPFLNPYDSIDTTVCEKSGKSEKYFWQADQQMKEAMILKECNKEGNNYLVQSGFTCSEFSGDLI